MKRNEPDELLELEDPQNNDYVQAVNALSNQKSWDGLSWESYVLENRQL